MKRQFQSTCFDMCLSIPRIATSPIINCHILRLVEKDTTWNTLPRWRVAPSRVPGRHYQLREVTLCLNFWRSRHGIESTHWFMHLTCHFVLQDFQYDSSIMAPLEEVPIWPYSLYYRMPHKCRDEVQRCPEKRHRLLEMVLNELDTGDDQCSFMFSKQCHAMADPEQFARALHTNRAPMGLNFHVNFFKQNKGLLAELTDFMDEAIDQHEVYFVTMQQVWLKSF